MCNTYFFYNPKALQKDSNQAIKNTHEIRWKLSDKSSYSQEVLLVSLHKVTLTFDFLNWFL